MDKSSAINIDFRKNNKRGGTKVGGDIVVNNLIKKFQEEEKNNEESDLELSGDVNMYAGKNFKKNHKRHASILVPLTGLDSMIEDIKKN